MEHILAMHMPECQQYLHKPVAQKVCCMLGKKAWLLTALTPTIA